MDKILLALLLAFSASAAIAKDVWEYKVEKSGRLNMSNPQYLASKLNTLGKNGWELTSVDHTDKQTWLFLKRKK